MARQKGSANFSGTIEPLAGGALDARTVVPTEADLLVASNFPYPYVGLPVVVTATAEMWILAAIDVTVASNWHKIGSGSGGSDNVVEGYYNVTDGKFYEESTYQTEIVGASHTIYISLDTNCVYRYDTTSSLYIELTAGGGEGQIIQVDTLPTASADELGNIYQYIGTTTVDYVNGLFYQCVENNGLYSWAYKTVNKRETVTLTQAQFDALPQAEKDNGTTYYISDSSAVQGIAVMGNRFDKANIYTNSERMVGSYLGKPLYQKTFNATVSSEYILVSGVFLMGSYSLLSENLDIADMPSADGFYIDGADTLSFIDVWYNSADSKLYFITYLEREDVDAQFTIQYTKNSDITVSVGTENDYSTEEQIIGTWINGKRLYQKVVIPSSGDMDKDTWVDIGTLGVGNDVVDAIIKIQGILRNSTSLIFYDVPEATLRINYNKSTDRINVYPQADWAQRPDFIIFQYTKATD